MLDMEDKITIIEGPPPLFEAVSENWALGMIDSDSLGRIAMTRLRTFNGPALLERCHRAWRHQQTIRLEFRTPEGLAALAPIVAARFMETPDGHVLLLWVRLNHDETEVEYDYGDDSGDTPPDDL
jgi:hypothetical protein